MLRGGKKNSIYGVFCSESFKKNVKTLTYLTIFSHYEAENKAARAATTTTNHNHNNNKNKNNKNNKNNNNNDENNENSEIYNQNIARWTSTTKNLRKYIR